jgi:hypothetical protein
MNSSLVRLTVLAVLLVGWAVAGALTEVSFYACMTAYGSTGCLPVPTGQPTRELCTFSPDEVDVGSASSRDPGRE